MRHFPLHAIEDIAYRTLTAIGYIFGSKPGKPVGNSGAALEPNA
jgi:hypothetical protein